MASVDPPAGLTRLLSELTDCDRRDGLDRALPLVYDELRALSGGILAGERADHTLQPTALVHEAYLRLIGRGTVWNDRGHFFRSAAMVMRHILINHARDRRAQKRGGGQAVVPLTEGSAILACDDHELLGLDEALTELAAIDESRAQVVELRFFAGCTIEETAEAIGISTATVERQWRFARVWLRSRMEDS